MKPYLKSLCLILCIALLFTGCAYRKAQKLYSYEAYDDAAELLDETGLDITMAQLGIILWPMPEGEQP